MTEMVTEVQPTTSEFGNLWALFGLVKAHQGPNIPQQAQAGPSRFLVRRRSTEVRRIIVNSISDFVEI